MKSVPRFWNLESQRVTTEFWFPHPCESWIHRHSTGLKNSPATKTAEEPVWMGTVVTTGKFMKELNLND